MSPVGFEHAVSASERLLTHALERAVTGIGYHRWYTRKKYRYYLKFVLQTFLLFIWLSWPTVANWLHPSFMYLEANNKVEATQEHIFTHRNYKFSIIRLHLATTYCVWIGTVYMETLQCFGTTRYMLHFDTGSSLHMHRVCIFNAQLLSIWWLTKKAFQLIFSH